MEVTIVKRTAEIVFGVIGILVYGLVSAMGGSSSGFKTTRKK